MLAFVDKLAVSSIVVGAVVFSPEMYCYIDCKNWFVDLNFDKLLLTPIKCKLLYTICFMMHILNFPFSVKSFFWLVCFTKHWSVYSNFNLCPE